MRRKDTPLHRLWHARVDGQIRHVMGQHPEYFSDLVLDPVRKEVIVNSLSKRIVGEIVAALASTEAA